MTKWYVTRDRDPQSKTEDNYTLSTHPDYFGWHTDSGHQGYGLPKEVAEWICDVLNKSSDKCPWELVSSEMWRKKKKSK